MWFVLSERRWQTTRPKGRGVGETTHFLSPGCAGAFPLANMVEYEPESGPVSPASSRGGGLQLPDFEESDFYVEQQQVNITFAPFVRERLQLSSLLQVMIGLELHITLMQ